MSPPWSLGHGLLIVVEGGERFVMLCAKAFNTRLSSRTLGHTLHFTPPKSSRARTATQKAKLRKMCALRGLPPSLVED